MTDPHRRLVEDDYDPIDPALYGVYDATAEFEAALNQFAGTLKTGARVLNIGGTVAECEFLLDRGLDVHDLRGSALTFIDEIPYDGIWTCRSLVRVPPVALLATLTNLRANLCRGGYYAGVFLITPGDRVMVQAQRALYPPDLLLKLHRQAGLKPLATGRVTDQGASSSITILAL